MYTADGRWQTADGRRQMADCAGFVLRADGSSGRVWDRPEYRFLYNSYYEAVGARHPRPERGLVTRPSLAEVADYRAHVDKEIGTRLAAGLEPELGAVGGTSDARFIKDFCPVAEFGLIGQTMHKVDERVAVADIRALAKVYEAVLERFFAA